MLTEETPLLKPPKPNHSVDSAPASPSRPGWSIRPIESTLLALQDTHTHTISIVRSQPSKSVDVPYSIEPKHAG